MSRARVDLIDWHVADPATPNADGTTMLLCSDHASADTTRVRGTRGGCNSALVTVRFRVFQPNRSKADRPPHCMGPQRRPHCPHTLHSDSTFHRLVHSGSSA